MRLFDAIESNDVRRLMAALESGADPNELARRRPYYRPLHAAIDALESGGPLDALPVLIRHGATVDATDGEAGATPLLAAVSRESIEAVRILLAAGADPTKVDREGDVPLLWAVDHNLYEIAVALLCCGAARDINDGHGPSGMSALGRAARRLDARWARLLLDHSADPRVPDADGRRPVECMPARTMENAERWDVMIELLKAR